MSIEISIQMQDGATRTVPLLDANIGLRRAIKNELCYPEDFGLSRQHLLFEKVDGQWTVKDLGSKTARL